MLTVGRPVEGRLIAGQSTAYEFVASNDQFVRFRSRSRIPPRMLR